MSDLRSSMKYEVYLIVILIISNLSLSAAEFDINNIEEIKECLLFGEV
jgi:hypothetical protein